jgi:hypothetical protein
MFQAGGNQLFYALEEKRLIKTIVERRYVLLEVEFNLIYTKKKDLISYISKWNR